MDKLNRQIAVLMAVTAVLVLLTVTLAVGEPLYTYFQGEVAAKLGNMPALEINKDGWLCGTQSSVGPEERFVLVEMKCGRMVCMRVAREEYDKLMLGSIVDIDWLNLWR